MWASYIMLTSLAPSPIARVILLKESLISFTTCAFYLGVTLQQTTESQFLAILTNSLLIYAFSIINANVAPSTTKDFFRFSFIHSWYVAFVSITLAKREFLSNS